MKKARKKVNPFKKNKKIKKGLSIRIISVILPDPEKNIQVFQWLKQTLLMDITLTAGVAPKNYIAVIAAMVRWYTGPIPNLLISLNQHWNM